jgi:SAM-dependent MidA family methyltransferase
MDEALYGPHGFYRSEQPADHFRTSAAATPRFGETLATLVARVDAALGSPQALTVVDMGAGDGQLLSSLLAVLPQGIRTRCEPIAVELRPRPPAIDDGIRWVSEPPTDIVGVVIANEWLDNVPCNVLELVDDELRDVLVEPHTGSEQIGGQASNQDASWVNKWWPIKSLGDRAEVGSTRDAAWRAVLSRMERGAAIAIDYGHTLDERASGAFGQGTVTGYRRGRQVAPTPDGSCDITAHVAMDACSAAGVQSGATETAMLRQREALKRLELSTTKPDQSLAAVDPARYVAGLSRASQAAELMDPDSLGALWWLVQTKNVPLNAVIGPR